MGVLRDFWEGTILRRRVEVETTNDSSMLNESFMELLESFVDSSIGSRHHFWNSIQKLYDISDDRQNRYNEFRSMEKDVLMSSALELYADDATQVDPQKGKRVWVEPEGGKYKNLVKDLNNFLDAIDADDKVWGWGYNLALYGDYYLRFYSDEEDDESLNILQEAIKLSAGVASGDGDEEVKSSRLLEDQEWEVYDNGDEGQDEEAEEDDGASMFPYVEEIDEPESVFDLTYRGKTVAYAIIDKDEADQKGVFANERKVQVLPPTAVVHFYITKAQKFDRIKLTLSGSGNKKIDGKETEFRVARGSSLFDNIRSTYRILNSMENSMLLSRIVRSAFVRVLNVEVGRYRGRKVTDMVRKVKRLFSFSEQMDMQDDSGSGAYSTLRSPAPLGEPIVMPTRDGVGQIRQETIGDDYNVKDIVDIEYFRNKLFAGLKIPKAFLGWEEKIPGSRGENLMTSLDIRYSRTVQRITTALRNGIRDLCNIYLIYKGHDEAVNQFRVCMVSPTTAEDRERYQHIDKRLGVASNVARLLVNDMRDLDVDQRELAKYLLEEYMDITDDDLLKRLMPEPEEEGQ